MNGNHIGFFRVLLVLCLFASPPTTRAQTVLQEVPTLAGTLTSSPFINDGGEEAGRILDLTSLAFRGFLREPNGQTTFWDLPRSRNAVSFKLAGINNSGQIAGTYEDEASESWAFVRHSDGRFETFHLSADTVVLGIDDAGQVTLLDRAINPD